MNRRALLVLVAVGVVGLGLYLWQGVFVSEEDRVRATLEDITDAFNEQRAGGVSSGLAKRIRLPGKTWNRADIRAGLAQVFLRELQRGEQRYRAELVESSWNVNVYESEHQLRADVSLEYLLHEKKGSTGTIAHERSVELELVKHEDEGWQVAAVTGGDRLPYNR